MSEIDSQQEGMEESQKKLETASPALSQLEADQNQLPSKGFEPNASETNVDQNSQSPPLNLETIYKELRLLRQDMQEGIQKVQSSINSLREEVAVLKQQAMTADSPIEQIDRKRKQTQPNNLLRKKNQNKQTRNNKFDFNAVTYLKEHGETELHEELKKKTNTELIQISRSLGIKIGKSSETMEREEMIKEILLQAERRLKAGSVFLKDNKDASET